jgi:hypothetical protein
MIPKCSKCEKDATVINPIYTLMRDFFCDDHNPEKENPDCKSEKLLSTSG